MTLARARATIDAYNVPGATCVKGCAHCCVGPIPVSAAELLEILPLVTREQRNAARLPTDRCPLLSADRTCSVYAIRPLVCRSFHSVAPPVRCATIGPIVDPDAASLLHSVKPADFVLLADAVAGLDR